MTKMRMMLLGAALSFAGALTAADIPWTFDENAIVREPSSVSEATTPIGLFFGCGIVLYYTSSADVPTAVPGLMILFR